jgi:hypothetical protein
VRYRSLTILTLVANGTILALADMGTMKREAGKAGAMSDKPHHYKGPRRNRWVLVAAVLVAILGTFVVRGCESGVITADIGVVTATPPPATPPPSSLASSFLERLDTLCADAAAEISRQPTGNLPGYIGAWRRALVQMQALVSPPELKATFSEAKGSLSEALDYLQRLVHESSKEEIRNLQAGYNMAAEQFNQAASRIHATRCSLDKYSTG